MKSLLHNLAIDLKSHMDSSEARQKLHITQTCEILGVTLLDRLRNGPILYKSNLQPPVLASARKALAVCLHKENAKWSCPEQALLVNSVGSSCHVIGVLPTGAGKSVAFFGAPILLPSRLFIVISPLVALTADLRRRLQELSIIGGVFGSDDLDPSTAQLCLVSAHIAGTDRFDKWVRSKSVTERLCRIFIDEAHKILTDDKFRPCFKLFYRLTGVGVPITFLSGSLMPRSVPDLLKKMKIEELNIVDEIRCYTGRPNLGYLLEDRLSSEDLILPRILELVRTSEASFKVDDRGIIYVSRVALAHEIAEALNCPKYIGSMDTAARDEAFESWRQGLASKWIVATEAFGQGVDFAHVRITIHENPSSLVNWYQECGRAGRDRLPAFCHTLWTRLPSVPPASDPDHRGQMEMGALLQTTNCIRLSCASLDRDAFSCNAIDGELCSNCTKVQEVRFISLLR